ncbi:hypothetical protein ACQE3D_09700 [Methylomonas sp. MS20]|uniref:hypothetical protein n=1 Tax=unclassified Methylomonas TaxID=2608980 RepID=UPI0028A4A118|nr:hypothetical protein [Methylomonas sp. MV1]MDT4328727.1 hypothetical protein [Methylomonas sp. MV1]
MNPLSNAEQDFLTKKTELQTAREDEASKRREIETLKQRQQQANAALAGLNQRLAQAGVAMANGDMTSDDYIALKRTIAEQELEREALGEVIEIQNAALKRLMEDSRYVSSQMWQQLAAAAGAVKQRALADVIEDREQHLKVFALAVSAHYLTRHPYTSQEKNEQLQWAYSIIGEELCKAVFADESEAIQIFVEPSLALNRIDEIISQAA